MLGNDDPEAAGIVAAALARDGVRIVTSVTIQRVERRQSIVIHVAREGRVDELEADAILVASGRVTNVEELGLDAAGVEYDERRVFTDDRLRTSNRRVYAVGDHRAGAVHGAVSFMQS